MNSKTPNAKYSLIAAACSMRCPETRPERSAGKNAPQAATSNRKTSNGVVVRNLASAASRSTNANRAARFRTAFTLVEMVLSTMVLTILIAVIGSALTVLLREGENNRNLMTSSGQGAASASAQAALARTAVDTLDADLKVANSILIASLPGGGVTVSLTVPSRYAGDISESLVYQWNGAGQALTRQLNGNARVAIADNVQSLNISALSKTAGVSPANSGN